MSNQPKLLHLKSFNDGRRGILSVIEQLPFEVKRVFCIYNVNPSEMRGGHAHKKCHQFFMAVHGAVLIKMVGNGDYVLDCPDTGLYVPPLNTINMIFLDEGATLMVLASEKYDPNDYIYGEKND